MAAHVKKVIARAVVLLGALSAVVEVLTGGLSRPWIAGAAIVGLVGSIYLFAGALPAGATWQVWLWLLAGFVCVAALVAVAGTFKWWPVRVDQQSASVQRTVISITSPQRGLSGGAIDITGVLRNHELVVEGVVSGLGAGETIWVANVPDQFVKQTLAEARMYPAFGPCEITRNKWKCDRVFLGDPGIYHIIALRATTKLRGSLCPTNRTHTSVIASQRQNVTIRVTFLRSTRLTAPSSRMTLQSASEATIDRSGSKLSRPLSATRLE
jgi:hypothetical protein